MIFKYSKIFNNDSTLIDNVFNYVVTIFRKTHERDAFMMCNVISFFATHTSRIHYQFTLLFLPQRLIILMKIRTRKIDRVINEIKYFT